MRVKPIGTPISRCTRPRAVRRGAAAPRDPRATPTRDGPRDRLRASGHRRDRSLAVRSSGYKSLMRYFLGLDIGTSGVKAALVDEKGGVKGSVTVAHPLSTPRPGWAEQKPESWWKSTV